MLLQTFSLAFPLLILILILHQIFCKKEKGICSRDRGQLVAQHEHVVFESGHYNEATAELTTDGTKIYEAKLGMSQSMADAANTNSNGHYSYAAGESFHFALNNYKK